MMIVFKIAASVTILMGGLAGLMALVSQGARYGSDKGQRRMVDVTAMITSVLVLLTYVSLFITAIMAVWAFL